MGAAHRGVDDIYFFAAAVEQTRLLAASVVSAQIPDAGGPLTPGRYLIQVLNQTDASALVWIKFGAFATGVVLTATTRPGEKKMPLTASGIFAIELHVLKGDSDRIAAITTAGTADVYITRVSRGA